MKLKTLATVILAGALAAGSGLAAGAPKKSEKSLAQRVRHELVTLPWYGVFDNLQYRIDGGTVTLSGQVIRPTLKSDAENVVKRLEGVDTVKNEIEVLPLSPFDDAIRLRVFRAVYRQLQPQYAMGAVPSIHIIVKNGNVTLTGAVSREMDRSLAFIAANTVFGVFSVTNELRIV
ncbi:MAG TPA: transport-associated protein [Solibacterales bacterium]|nr:transport-associated protein [Bryobacterales bacterium]